jgi:hypothetical protein
VLSALKGVYSSNQGVLSRTSGDERRPAVLFRSQNLGKNGEGGRAHDGGLDSGSDRVVRRASLEEELGTPPDQESGVEEESRPEYSGLEKTRGR